MAYIITFETSKFDISKETKNPINQIYGHSLLDWLKSNCKEKVKITTPEAEDWGWYAICSYYNKEYTLGSSVYYNKGDNQDKPLKWVFQIEKNRTFLKKLFKKEQMDRDDKCLKYFYDILKLDKEISNIEIE